MGPTEKVDIVCEEAVADEPSEIAPNADPGVDEAKGSAGMLS